MLAGITTRGRFGCPTRYPGPGQTPIAGPVVTLSFLLALAGPVPRELDTQLPQMCQNSTPNVALQVQVLDQDDQPVDLSAAVGLLFWLLAPDGTARAVGASFVSNGLDGKIQYVTSAQDLNEAGYWNIQAQVTFATSALLTGWGTFRAGLNVVDA